MVTGALVGKVLASFVGAYIAPLIGWRYTFLLSVIPALITLYIRKSIKESDVWEHRKKDFNQPYSKVKTFCEIIFPKYRFIFIKSLILAFLGVSAYWFTNSWMPECFKIQRHLTGGGDITCSNNHTTWLYSRPPDIWQDIGQKRQGDRHLLSMPSCRD